MLAPCYVVSCRCSSFVVSCARTALRRRTVESYRVMVADLAAASSLVRTNATALRQVAAAIKSKWHAIGVQDEGDPRTGGREVKIAGLGKAPT